jgi:hypothetical protein
MRPLSPKTLTPVMRRPRGQEIVDETHQLESLDRARVNGDRSRLRRSVRGFVDHPALYAVARQLMSHDQPGRTGPDDQHSRLVVHGGTPNI